MVISDFMELTCPYFSPHHDLYPGLQRQCGAETNLESDVWSSETWGGLAAWKAWDSPRNGPAVVMILCFRWIHMDPPNSSVFFHIFS